MSNQTRKIRTKIIDVNNNESAFYPFNIKVNKCSGSCNNINDPYAKLCAPNVAKNINVRVLNLMPWSNQTRHIEWYENCKCKCRLNARVCNNKQIWNEDKCGCEFREKLIDKGKSDKGVFWNPGDCKCECDKSCDVGQYLDYKNFKCRNNIIGELVEECTENIYENEMMYNETLNTIPLIDHKKMCNSCTICILLFSIFLIISIGISSVFIYFHWYIRKVNIPVKFNPNTQTKIYRVQLP